MFGDVNLTGADDVTIEGFQKCSVTSLQFHEHTRNTD